MASQDIISLLLRVVQAFNDRELDFLEQSVTDGFTRYDLAGAFLAQRSGGAEVRNLLQVLLRAIPDLRLDVMDMVPSGDRVAMRYQFSGTHQGNLLGIPPTDRPVEFSGINIYRFEGEKIAEVWQLWDWASVLHQIGVLDWPPTNHEATSSEGVTGTL